MKTKLIILVYAITGLWSISSNCFAQAKFSRADLAADLDTLYSVIYQVYPDLFALLPQAEFEQELTRVKASLPDSADIHMFFFPVAELVAGPGPRDWKRPRRK